MWYFPYVDELFEWFRVGYFNLQDYNNPVADYKKFNDYLSSMEKSINIIICMFNNKFCVIK